MRTDPAQPRFVSPEDIGEAGPVLTTIMSHVIPGCYFTHAGEVFPGYFNAHVVHIINLV